MIEHALSILGTHFIWQLNTFIIGAAASDQPDLLALAGLCESRSTLVAKLEEFSVGQNSNAAEGVKQTVSVTMLLHLGLGELTPVASQALSLLLDIHVLSNSAASAKRDPDGQLADLRLPCSEELQARCAGFIEAEIERHLDELTLLRAAEESEDAVQSEEEEDEDSDDDAATQKQKKAAAAKAKKAKAAKKGGKEDVPKKKSASQIRGKLLLCTAPWLRIINPSLRQPTKPRSILASSLLADSNVSSTPSSAPFTPAALTCVTRQSFSPTMSASAPSSISGASSSGRTFAMKDCTPSMEASSSLRSSPLHSSL